MGYFVSKGKKVLVFCDSDKEQQFESLAAHLKLLGEDAIKRFEFFNIDEIADFDFEKSIEDLDTEITSSS